MWVDVIGFLEGVLLSIIDWYIQIFDAVPGMWDTLFTLFLILTIARFLLMPVLGSAAGFSDYARKHVTNKNKGYDDG